MNMTPLRLKVLRFLADGGHAFNPKYLVQELCPRDTTTGAWTEQGAARMAGKIIKPLTDEGLVKDEEWRARMCDRFVYITDKGRKVLAEHDEAASRAALDQAITSGT